MTPSLQKEVQHSAPWITSNEADAVALRIQSGWVAQGECAARFAESLRAMHDASQVTLTSSGTAALTLSLRALGVGAGDEVVLPAYVCASVREAVLMTGATPVLCDIGDRWLMTVDTVKIALTKKTRAVIAVSLYGFPADVAGISTLGIPVIDDRCQAFGLSKQHGRHAAFSVCSFHATKCLTAGEGGAVISWNRANSELLIAAARSARRTLCVFSDLQATLAQSQLQRWPQLLDRRRVIASRYISALPEWRVAAVCAAATVECMWFRFVVTLAEFEDFDDLRARFARYDVQVRRGVDALLHRDGGRPDVDFPNAVRAYERTLSLPMWPAMSDEQVDHAIEVATDVLGH